MIWRNQPDVNIDIAHLQYGTQYSIVGYLMLHKRVGTAK